MGRKIILSSIILLGIPVLVYASQGIEGGVGIGINSSSTYVTNPPTGGGLGVEGSITSKTLVGFAQGTVLCAKTTGAIGICTTSITGVVCATCT